MKHVLLLLALTLLTPLLRAEDPKVFANVPYGNRFGPADKLRWSIDTPLRVRLAGNTHASSDPHIIFQF